MKRRRLGLACLSCGLVGLLAVTVVQAQSQSRDLEQEKAQAVAAQKALKARLESLQNQLQKTQRQQKQAADALQASEVAISATIRRMRQLDALLKKAEQELAALEQKIALLSKRIDSQRKALAVQLRAQYSSGLNAWSALLAGEDPQAIGRDLGYLEFVSRSRTENIASLQQDKAELSRLSAAQIQQKQSIVENRQTLAAEQKTLAQEKAEREKVLASLNKQLVQERTQAKRLDDDQQRLNGVVDALSKQIEQWREQQLEQQLEQQRAQQREQQHEQQIKQAREGREAAAALAALPQGDRLKRGLPKPVSGPVQARFGSKQPDGGVWRGILMGAKEGDPVKAVAPGMVVFAKWLPQFGNLVILDHGDEFLTVYAYNQSLLKEVGEDVGAGEVVALAGNTGGQLDSALYFELRHRGAPLDPMLYFKNE